MFPKWINPLRDIAGAAAGLGAIYIVALFWIGASPRARAIGYQPVQPVPFSHALHAGEMGMDCRYCHNTVEKSSHAAVPPTETCMNCHQRVHPESAKLLPIRESFATGEPVEWVRIHDLPDYSYFNHSAHVTRGVGCVSCHGRIDKMEVVYQHEPLNMGWCLDCHRNPEQHLRPVEHVTHMDWTPNEPQEVLGARLRAENNINPSTDCSTCHR